jgi:dienelactone hydrolase
MNTKHGVFTLGMCVGLLLAAGPLVAGPAASGRGPSTAHAVLGAPPSGKTYFPPDAAGPAAYGGRPPAYTLPDVLTTTDGRKIATPEDWRKIRRPEVLELFRKHVYGRVPETPFQTSFKMVNEDANAMDGAARLKQVDVTIANGPKSLTIHLVLFVPSKAAKPVPAFLLICNRPPAENIDPTRKVKSEFWPAEEVVARGYAMAAFFVGDVDPDKYDGFKDGAHGLLDVGERKPDAWGTIAAWAWGASRVMDYFETDKDIARDKVAVIGHSRGGKTALWAGAQDERFALTVSNDSGCGGAALSRRRTKEKETVARINKSFPHWFCETFKSYNDKEDALPVDQHMLIALMAPRAVYVASADKDLWADPRGEFLSVVHAAPANRLFGKKGLGTAEMPAIGEPVHGDGAAYHIREGKHNLTLFDWQRYMDFADKVFGRKRD